MSKHNLPTESGLYWASNQPMAEEWELLAKVYGQTPFMQCTVWEYLSKQKLVGFYRVEKLYFGPRIDMPKRDPRARPLGKEEIVT